MAWSADCGLWSPTSCWLWCFLLGLVGSELLFSEAADIAESPISGIPREVFQVLLPALPEPSFPELRRGTFLKARGLSSRDGHIQNVAGVFDGCLVQIINPRENYKVAFITRKCFYGVNLLAIFASK